MRERLAAESKAALKSQDKRRLSALRLITAELQKADIAAKGGAVPEQDIPALLQRMIKQRRESITQYEKASRQDLADAEKFELELLSGYLPQQMGDAELQQEVQKAIGEAGASGIKDMGKVMALLKSRLAGRADIGKVSNLVKSKLS